MTLNGWIQIALYCVIIIALTRPFGGYMTRVFNGERTLLSPLFRPVERLFYSISGVRENEDQHWLVYAIAMLAFTPGIPSAYNITLTFLSLVAAVVLTGVGLVVALNPKIPAAPWLGGAIVGGALASPYYYGPGYGYYGPGYGYYGGPAYVGGPGPGYAGDCYWQQQRFWDGYAWRFRRVRVCG